MKKAFLVTIAMLCSNAIADSPRYQRYNSSTAVAYANQWVFARNPKYPNYGTEDCTNFASQVLQAGGWKNTLSNSSTSITDWYSVGNKQYQTSYTWRAVAGLRNRLVGGYEKTTSIVTAANKLSPGDLIFFDFNGDGAFDHTTIVVGMRNYVEPILSYHSTDTKQITHTDFIKKIASNGFNPSKIRSTMVHISPY